MNENPKIKDLLFEIDRLKSLNAELKLSRPYGLVWQEKEEQFETDTKNGLPVLTEKGGKFSDVQLDPASDHNVLIEGDNYHSLSLLSYTHKKKLDLIYIDPPYNTGARDWKYNNDYVDAEDPWRHSKWISMMHKRLLLARDLLNEEGVLICAIDDYELNTLGLLIDKIFGSYERDLIIVEHHPQGAGSNTVSRTHEYAYVVTPKGLGIVGRAENSGEEGRWSLKRSGQGENNWRKGRPNQFFAILVDEKERKVVGVEPSITRDAKNYPTEKTKEGYTRIYPLDRQGGERVWRYNPAGMTALIKSGAIEYTDAGSLIVKKKGVAASPIFSVWKGPRYNAGTHGTGLLTKIFGHLDSFPYPKSLYTVMDMVEMIVKHREDAIVLDFFAGSGTTGHAVLELNKQDQGNRRFILCTNNEGNICETLTFERMKRVMEGYKGPDGEMVEGLGGNLKYLKTDFVPKHVEYGLTDEARLDLARRANLLLALKENTFTSIGLSDNFEIFTSPTRATGVYFSENKSTLEKMLKALDKYSSTHITTAYIFSWEKGAYKAGFEEYPNIKFEDIPEPILEVYRSIGY